MKKIILSITLLFFYISNCYAEEKVANNNEIINIIVSPSLVSALNEISREFTRIYKIMLNVEFINIFDEEKFCEKNTNPDLIIYNLDKDTLKKIFKSKSIDLDNGFTLASNKLVLIEYNNESNNIIDPDKPLSDIIKEKINTGKLIIANPKNTALGIYSKEILKALNIWNDAQSNITVINNSQELINKVITEKTTAIAYFSDTKNNSNVRIISDLPDKFYEKIEYKLIITNYNNNKDIITKFNEFLKSQYTKNILKKYGFE